MAKVKKAASAGARKARSYSSYAEWEALHLPEYKLTDSKMVASESTLVSDILSRHSLELLREAARRPR